MPNWMMHNLESRLQGEISITSDTQMTSPLWQKIEEENNRVGKRIRDTKGTFHAKMGTIKYRNGMDLTETEDIKKRWQEYTEELYKKKI